MADALADPSSARMEPTRELDWLSSETETRAIFQHVRAHRMDRKALPRD